MFRKLKVEKSNDEIWNDQISSHTQGPVRAAPARGHCVKVPEAVKERSQPQGFPPWMIDTCQAPSLRPQSHPHPSFHL